MQRIEEILQFWFRDIDDRTTIKKDHWPFKMWFMKDARNDDQIKKEFEGDLIKAVDGEYAAWEGSVRGRLALILLYDQFTRNMYRASARMFTFDDRALQLSLRTIDEQMDAQAMLIERVFLYMPLQHSEQLKDQEASLNRFRSLVDESKTINPANAGYYEYTLDFARRHYEIIKRFNRFPHRNEILGRESTTEEVAFLKKPGSGF